MSKLLPGNETVLAMPAVEIDGVPYIFHASTGAAVSMFAATKAVLDSWIARTDNTGGTIGGNISGAIRDDMRLGLTDSATSTSRTITSVGKGEKLTYHNFVATLNIFRDADADPSTFNLAKDTTRVQDVPFVLAHRLGAKHTAAATVGEDWSYYFVHTGQPVPGFGDGEDQTIALAFVPKNIVHVKAALETAGESEYAPSITSHPSSASVVDGGTATFTAAATGDPAPTVQWQVSDDDGATWNDIAGATSTSFTTGTLDIATDDGLRFRAVFVNSEGSAASNSATLTVTAAPVVPTITTTSLSAATQGSAFSQTIAATGDAPITWSIPTGALPAGLSLNASTGAITGTPTAAGAYSFTLRATNAAGHDDQAFSGTVAAASTPTQPTVVYSTQSIQSVSGATHTLEVVATSDLPLTYQWEDGGTYGSSWSNIAGATGSSYTTPAITASRFYRCKITNSAGSVYAHPASISIVTSALAPTVIRQPPASINVVAGESILLAGGMFNQHSGTMQWQTRPDSSSSWVNVSGGTAYPVAGKDNNPYYKTPVLSSGDNGRQYRVTFTNGAGSVTTNAITLTVAAAAAPAATFIYDALYNFSDSGGYSAGSQVELELSSISGSPTPTNASLLGWVKVNSGSWLPVGCWFDHYSSTYPYRIGSIIPVALSTYDTVTFKWTITTSSGQATLQPNPQTIAPSGG